MDSEPQDWWRRKARAKLDSHYHPRLLAPKTTSASQTLPPFLFSLVKIINKENMEETYKIKSGKYKCYEVCWTNSGQIFPRAGFYLQKSGRNEIIKDILYLEEALKE